MSHDKTDGIAEPLARKELLYLYTSGAGRSKGQVGVGSVQNNPLGALFWTERVPFSLKEHFC